MSIKTAKKSKGEQSGIELKHKNQKMMMGILFSLPIIIGLVVFFFVPMAQSAIFSFANLANTRAGLVVKSFAGFSNYIFIFNKHPSFRQDLVTAILTMISSVPVIVIFSFFAANLINQKFLGRNVIRVIFFLPIVLASAAMLTLDTGDIMQNTMRDYGYRAVDSASSFLQSFKLSEFMNQLGLPPEVVSFLSQAVDTVYQIISLSGIQILIILASLQSISPSLYEAAHVEGASGWEKFWIVTFPMTSATILLTTVYSIIDSFIAYNNPIIRLAQTMMVKDLQYEYSATVSWIYFGVMVVILGIVMFIGNKLVFNYDEKL